MVQKPRRQMDGFQPCRITRNSPSHTMIINNGTIEYHSMVFFWSIVLIFWLGSVFFLAVLRGSFPGSGLFQFQVFAF